MRSTAPPMAAATEAAALATVEVWDVSARSMNASPRSANGPGGLSRARSLSDECLSLELAWLARERGHAAHRLRDLGLLEEKDGQLAPIIFGGDRCFVTKNARHFRGPDDAKGSAGEYAGVEPHAGLACIHGPPEGFTKASSLKPSPSRSTSSSNGTATRPTCWSRSRGGPTASPTRWPSFPQARARGPFHG